jgi:hypothetical protein
MNKKKSARNSLISFNSFIFLGNTINYNEKPDLEANKKFY